MEILFKENVVFNIFNDETELKEKILDFIFDSKTDKILYKGNPTEINYKLLKKILPLEKLKFEKDADSINNFVDINEEKNVREVYFEFLDKVECPYCLIYKR